MIKNNVNLYRTNDFKINVTHFMANTDQPADDIHLKWPGIVYERSLQVMFFI